MQTVPESSHSSSASLKRPFLSPVRRSLTATACILFVLAFAACAKSTISPPPEDSTGKELSGKVLTGIGGYEFPLAPQVPVGPLSSETAGIVQQLIQDLRSNDLDTDLVAKLGQSGDPRVLWFVRDLMLFITRDRYESFVLVFETLTSVELPGENYNEIADHLIAWDLPAFPGYREAKKALFSLISPNWAPFFDDTSSDIDWRFVQWGGVWIDDRLDGSPGVPCFQCIPALDDPPVTGTEEGSWYPDERLVFGVVINGEARAYPKNIMEVHEMVNDTLGGRRIGIPYCTLCGSAQGYYTDDIKGFSPVLRTTGLLTRSNKVMYDISTMSVIDTFTGRAVSGPLHDAGVLLNQVSVVTSSWAEWKRAHPDTTIVAGDGGIEGTIYPLDPLRGRDDNGPIFSVGDVDPRLPVQKRVLGVETPDGIPVAFPVDNAATALKAGELVEMHGIRLELEGSGLRAFSGDRGIPGHEAFWFAWSQFNPGTQIWQR